MKALIDQSANRPWWTLTVHLKLLPVAIFLAWPPPFYVAPNTTVLVIHVVLFM